MRFALVNGARREASPRLRGACPLCGSAVISKCGQFKVWHWAHKQLRDCDSWAEPETDWHRSWKNEFPVDWQEVVHTGVDAVEAHIADVRTPDGLVIEFQHSYIKRDEVQAREAFYGRLIWIVDAQPESDSTNARFFRMGLRGPVCRKPLTYRVSWHNQNKLLQKWGASPRDVYLDFRDSRDLWRLIDFDATRKEGLVLPIDRGALIHDCKTGAPSLGTRADKNATLREIREVYKPSLSVIDKARRKSKHVDTGQMSLLGD